MRGKKPKENPPKFIGVFYGDSDFAFPVEAALRRLWKFITENNASLVGAYTNRTIPIMFEELHRAGALKPMILRLIDVEYLASLVEIKTRGLAWERVDWKGKRECQPLHSITKEYLCPSVTLYKTDVFTQQGGNGEHAYLNLETGEIKIPCRASLESYGHRA